MNQNERLDYLIDSLKKESIRYKNLSMGNSTEEKRKVLRSLMNVRMPADMDKETQRIQDDYLKERIKENGIVSLNEIKTIDEFSSRRPQTEKISIWKGDITRLKVDVIVNAANSQMLGCFIPMHTCIDNCIHTFAGMQLRSECYRQMNLKRIKYGQDYEQPTAEPLLTDGYNLPCRKIIHVVGPIVESKLKDSHRRQLSDCYRNCLDLCKENGLRSIAFCCISTGVFRFPNDEAAHIAVQTVTEWLENNPDNIDRIIFNVFKDEDRRLYEQELSE